jgi:hypothetical protein
MCKESNQGSPLVTCTILQFLLDSCQIVEQAIELRVLTSQQCLVLIERYSGKAIYQLVHGHVLELGPLHGDVELGSSRRLEDAKLEIVD